MKLFAVFLAGFISVFSISAVADDIEGKVEAIKTDEQSFVVQGITFYVSESTHYEDGLKGLSDLQEGQKVEVDFRIKDGKHIATEIELDD